VWVVFYETDNHVGCNETSPTGNENVLGYIIIVFNRHFFLGIYKLSFGVREVNYEI